MKYFEFEYLHLLCSICIIFLNIENKQLHQIALINKFMSLKKKKGKRLKMSLK